MCFDNFYMNQAYITIIKTGVLCLKLFVIKKEAMIKFK